MDSNKKGFGAQAAAMAQRAAAALGLGNGEAKRLQKAKEEALMACRSGDWAAMEQLAPLLGDQERAQCFLEGYSARSDEWGMLEAGRALWTLGFRPDVRDGECGLTPLHLIGPVCAGPYWDWLMQLDLDWGAESAGNEGPAYAQLGVQLNEENARRLCELAKKGFGRGGDGKPTAWACALMCDLSSPWSWAGENPELRQLYGDLAQWEADRPGLAARKLVKCAKEGLDGPAGLCLSMMDRRGREQACADALGHDLTMCNGREIQSVLRWMDSFGMDMDLSEHLGYCVQRKLWSAALRLAPRCLGRVPEDYAFELFCKISRDLLTWDAESARMAFSLWLMFPEPSGSLAAPMAEAINSSYLGFAGLALPESFAVWADAAFRRRSIGDAWKSLKDSEWLTSQGKGLYALMEGAVLQGIEKREMDEWAAQADDGAKGAGDGSGEGKGKGKGKGRGRGAGRL